MSIPPPGFSQEPIPHPAGPSAVPPTLPPGLDQPTASSRLEFSDWWLRVAAALLDGLIIGAPVLVASIILIVAFGNSPGASLLRLLLALAAGIAYYVKTMTREGPSNGQTLGKQLVGIRVVRDDGLPVGPGVVLRRELLIKGPLTWVTLGVFELVDCLWPLGDATNRALHDKIVKTHVFQYPGRSGGASTAFAIVGGGLLVFFLMGLLAAIAIPTFLHQRVDAQQNAAQVQALEHDMGAAFAVEREAGLRNNPPALDTGAQLVGDIGTAAPALHNLLSSNADPGRGDATVGVIYLGATTPTAFEAVAYTVDGTRVACGVTGAAAGCTATGA
ncbi:MAG: RDD family protein [Solirubrobacterales bacterium]|nr:RDD family protein [Solirubrobacterales bacterium]